MSKQYDLYLEQHRLNVAKGFYWIQENLGELLIDIWWAFSRKDMHLGEIFNWYNQHFNYIKLSDETRSTVENILSEIAKKLIHDGTEEFANITLPFMKGR
jgi:hypothetical protein